MTPTQLEIMVTARLLELVDHRTAWHRSLWQVGSILALRELLEYAEGVRESAIRPEGLSYVAGSVSKLVRRDRGLGPQSVRDQICEIVDLASDKKKGPVNAAVADTLGQLARRAQQNYLERWAQICEQGELQSSNVELLARLVANHLLDGDFSADHIHGWLRARTDEDPRPSLAALLRQADEMWRRPYVDYQVIVPFAKLPSEVTSVAGDRFLAEDQLEKLCAEKEIPQRPAGRRGVGSLSFTVRAREPFAAVSAAENEVRRLDARVAVGMASGQVEPTGHALVMSTARPKWRPLRSWRKEVRVASLIRHDLLLPDTTHVTQNPLDDAFELLAAVESSTSWASVAAGWATVEGLLARPSDTGADAADRLAFVVACSFPRAESTQLVEVLSKNDDSLGEKLRNDSLPMRRRIDILLEELRLGTDLTFNQPTDQAAIKRLQDLLAEPRDTLTRVQGYCSDAFRRLYQQRNLVMHRGRFDSVALPATLRTVPSLVAAGVDRLVHAAMSKPATEPLGLAARAAVELSLVGAHGGRPIHRLLD